MNAVEVTREFTPPEERELHRWHSPVTSLITDDNGGELADLVGSNRPVCGGPLGRCPCVDPKPPSGLPASNMQTVVA
jgi:hypothetical protein